MTDDHKNDKLKAARKGFVANDMPQGKPVHANSSPLSRRVRGIDAGTIPFRLSSPEWALSGMALIPEMAEAEVHSAA